MGASETEDLQRLGRNLREARTALGWTQEELGAALADGGSQPDRGYISRIESGKHNPSVGTLIRLGRALGVAPGALLDGIE